LVCTEVVEADAEAVEEDEERHELEAEDGVESVKKLRK